MPIQMQMTLPDLPKNYEYTGEIRKLFYGDLYLRADGDVRPWAGEKASDAVYIVVRRVKPFVPFEISKMGERFAKIRGVSSTGQRIEVERAKVIAMRKTESLERPSFTIEYGKGITITDVTYVEVQ